MLALSLPSQVSPALAEEDVEGKAQQQFELGVAAFEQRRLAQAAQHFAAAYELSPAFGVLYYIGQVKVALGRHVEAVEAFEQYLSRGGSAIDPSRREEVQAEVDRQRAQIAVLKVAVVPEGASVRLDGRVLGASPLPSPTRMDAGHHVVDVDLSGYESARREFEAEGGSDFHLEIQLRRLETPPPPPTPPPAAVNKAGTQSSSPIRKIARDPLARSGRSAVLGYSMAATAVGLVVTGTAIALTARTRASEAYDDMAQARTPGAWQDAKSDHDAARTANVAGWIVAGVGVGLGTVGATLLIINRRASVRLLPGLPSPTRPNALHEGSF